MKFGDRSQQDDEESRDQTAMDNERATQPVDADSDPAGDTRLAESARDGPESQSQKASLSADLSDRVPELPADRIGRYRLERLLGRGGFGSVYLAEDEQLGRKVAVKVAHRRLFRENDAAAIYLDEARHIAKLDHPNIAPVYDAGSTDEFPFYFVAKYIDGKTLTSKIGSDQISFSSSAQIALAVAEALQHAHKQGLVHRDVKPGNILIDSHDQAYLVDFGLALSEDSVENEIRYVGTPTYTSPEQARGEGHRVDGRSDVFSLGVVLYEMLTRRRPFRGQSSADILRQVVDREPRPPRQFDESIPKELERICQRAMAKLATERYQSAFDFADDLRHFLRPATPVADSVTPVSPVTKNEKGPEQDRATAEGLTAVEQGSSTKRTSEQTASDSGDTGSSRFLSADSRSLSVVPKGIRSFDADDAEFYLELLPGTRDRDGLPVSIRFWKQRIENSEDGDLVPIGIIYGPSGCGKSSFIRAGLIPRLSESIQTICINADRDGLADRLSHALRLALPKLPPEQNLVDLVRLIRRGHGLSPQRKVLIVIDQFEQWLHGRSNEDDSLIDAVRQCDGSRIQVVVLVRDDFWMAMTAFMRDLEIRIVEGQNAMGIDLLPIRRATKILDAFGRAYSALPPAPQPLSSSQEDFLKQAVTQLSRNGKVVCVRLALFAETMKSQSWTIENLKAVGGAQGVGLAFLEQAFEGEQTPLAHRYHQNAARKTLRALLPGAGSTIREHSCSRLQLNQISGYGIDSTDFDELLAILDGELRLITPRDSTEKAFEGSGIEPDANQDDEKAVAYQLTHDYLVEPLRIWLDKKQRETRRGRTELLLSERAQLWSPKQESRHLPSLVEDISIRRLTDRNQWNADEQRMMHRSGRLHGGRIMVAAGIVLAAMVLGFFTLNRLEGQRNAARAETLIDGLQSAELSKLSLSAEQVAELEDWTVPIMRQRLESLDNTSDEHLRLSLAIVPHERSYRQPLLDRLGTVAIDQFPIVRDGVSPDEDELEKLWQRATNEQTADAERFQIGCALAAYAPGSDRHDDLIPFLLKRLILDDVIVSASELIKRIEHLRPLSQRVTGPLVSILRSETASKQSRERTSIALAEYSAESLQPAIDGLLLCRERNEFVPLLEVLTNLTSDDREQLSSIAGDATVEVDREYRDQHHRSAIAAALLARLGDPKALLDIYRGCMSSPNRDRSLWTLAKHYAAVISIETDLLLQWIDNDTFDLAETREFIELLGFHAYRSRPAAAHQAIVDRLTELATEHPDAGVHFTADWARQQFGETPTVRPTDAPRVSGDASVLTQEQSEQLKTLTLARDTLKTQLDVLRDVWQTRLREAPVPEQTLIDDSLKVHVLARKNGLAVLRPQPATLSDPSRQSVEQASVTGGVMDASIEMVDQEPINLGDAFQPRSDQPFSYGCWVYYDIRAGRDVWGAILSKFDTGDGTLAQHRGFDLWIDGDQHYGMHLVHQDPDQAIKVLTKDYLDIDRWRHVFVTYDGSAKAAGVRIFFDGKPVETEAGVDDLQGTIETDAPLLLGSRNGNYRYYGWIDDVRIYDRELAGDEIRTIYESGVGTVLRKPAGELSREQALVLDNYRPNDEAGEILGKLELADRSISRVRRNAFTEAWQNSRRWYVNSQKQSFAIVPTALSSTPETVPYDYAIGVHEVTIEQYQASRLNSRFDAETSESMRSPADRLTWFQIAEYCNWLSLQEGIDSEQWCFEPNAEGQYDWGMKLKPDFHRRQGYRLPTEEEWFHAGRAGVKTRFHFGTPADLIDRYVWYAGNAGGITRDVGRLAPNPNGIFDIHGNVWEFTCRMDNVDQYGTLRKDRANTYIRGGAMNSGSSYVNLGGVDDCSPDDHSHYYGFRLARTLPVD